MSVPLTEKKKRKILELYGKGVTIKDIAKVIGCSKPTVRKYTKKVRKNQGKTKKNGEETQQTEEEEKKKNGGPVIPAETENEWEEMLFWKLAQE